jgi:type II secretory pathway pseudopilin PulG
MRDTKARGFTLVEVLAILAIFIILLAATIILLRPKSFVAADTDAQRRLGLAAIAQGLQEFRHATGSYPAAIPAEATSISSPSAGFNLCAILVPKHLTDIPLDPELGIAYMGDATNPELVTKPCNTVGVSYVSGYTIKQAKDGVITLGAIGSNLKLLELTLR